MLNDIFLTKLTWISDEEYEAMTDEERRKRFTIETFVLVDQHDGTYTYELVSGR